MGGNLILTYPSDAYRKTIRLSGGNEQVMASHEQKLLTCTQVCEMLGSVCDSSVFPLSLSPEEVVSKTFDLEGCEAATIADVPHECTLMQPCASIYDDPVDIFEADDQPGGLCFVDLAQLNCDFVPYAVWSMICPCQTRNPTKVDRQELKGKKYGAKLEVILFKAAQQMLVDAMREDKDENDSPNERNEIRGKIQARRDELGDMNIQLQIAQELGNEEKVKIIHQKIKSSRDKIKSLRLQIDEKDDQ